eukprot:CAMPEP_0116558268 /NCGR_PEP_ID=MMETSP0397-20121206/9718_1 /TAXON_ID=216820 /ORGANISM="Cyclophora tenuis, Strain ECT3854" /LENGTH=156 /DNA_ID=CAMNT_0004083851 /DNA_START=36 /DNA_END=506 /DNA_ORIENTATION=-
MTGVACFALQRNIYQKPPRWCRSFANNALQKLRQAVEGGKTDCDAYCMLLLAEECALRTMKNGSNNNSNKNNVEKEDGIRAVKAAYDAAARTAKEAGMIQFEAVALERAGRTFLELHHRDLAQKYLSEAHDTFLDWGSEAKCDHLDRFMRHRMLRT